MRDHEVTRLIDIAARDATWLAPRLANTMRRVEEWAGLGYPAGGSSGTRGGDTTPLPERLAVAGIPDPFAADLLEAEVTIRAISEGFAWLRAFDARNQPLDLERRRRVLDDRPTATCGNQLSANELLKGCGEVVANVGDNRIKRGLCPKCYTAWQRSFTADVEPGEAAHYG